MPCILASPYGLRSAAAGLPNPHGLTGDAKLHSRLKFDPSAPVENWVPVDRAGWRRVSGHPQAMTTRLRKPLKVGSP
jgi:hypothetical protein